MPAPLKVRAPHPATPAVSPERDPRARTGQDRRTSGSSAMEPGPSAVVRARAVAGNAAVTAAMRGSPPGLRPSGQMMLAGQDVVGNQAVAARAGASAPRQPATRPVAGKKPVQKVTAPPTPRPGQKDTKGTEDRADSGAEKRDAAGPRSPGAAGGVGLAGPRRLSLPSFARRFTAQATLPPVRATAADRDALAAAARAFSRLVERARRAHDAQRPLLERLGRTALDRHHRVDGRTRSRVTATEAELDDLRLQALSTVDTAYQEGIDGLDLAVRRGRGLVAVASSRALGRLRANADTAGDQITTIVNDLASGYTDLLEHSAVEITTAAGQAIAAVQTYGASAPFQGGRTPLDEAKNEARRQAVPGLAKAAVAALGQASTTQSEAYRAQIPVVRKQFSESELARALTTRKNEIDTKGRAAVERATRTAYGALSKQAASGREALRRMVADARESIGLRHKAAKARLNSEAGGLLHSSHAQAAAELTGLETAATTGLPAYERMITSVRDGLKRAAAISADSLHRTAEEAADDTAPKVDQLGVVQQRLVTRADASTAKAVADAERAAILSSGRTHVAAAGALRETGAGGARGMGDFVGGHDASFAATARGVRQVADAWAMPLAKLFGDAVSKTKEAMTGPFTEWKTTTETGLKDYVGAVFTPYLNPATPLAGPLEEAAEKVAADLEVRQAGLERAFDHPWGTDEEGVSNSLRGLTPTQGRALRWKYDSDHGSLEAALRDELSGADLTSALAYLRGDQVAGAAAELEASTHWYNDEEARIENIMRNLKPEELEQLKGSKEGAEALADVRDSLGGTDLKVFDALAAGNQDLADAFRMKEKIDGARKAGDLDAIHDVLIEYGKAPTERGRAQATADERRVAVQQELAGIVSGSERGAAPITAQQAAAAVEKYALAPIEVIVAGPEGTTSTEKRDITGANRDLAVALIHGGENTVAARAARLGVETQRAGGPNMLKLDAALVDPRLKPGADVPEEERRKALAERGQIFQKYAADYGGARQAGTAASAQSYLEGRLRAAYGADKDAGELAVRLTTEVYPTPKTAALAMKYAKEGAGTDEALMFRFVERMDRDEIALMRGEYKNITGTALDDDLGTFGGSGMFTELSGDERLRMEVALLGVPRNDRERAEVAAFRIQQQRDETGGLGAELAGDSIADRSLALAQSRLTATLGGATVRVDDKGNPVWTDAEGKPMAAPGGALFDETGKYAGKNPAEFASAVRVSKLAAENYAAKVDSFATYLTTAVMVIGAVAAAVATVATGGGASPLLLAAIAGLTGVSSMAVHSAVSGGRYGWEQAAVDLGMTAVQALTAGVGQHLSIVARGGTQSLAAGMTTLRSVQNLSSRMGVITGSALGDLAVIGVATGGLGGLGGALLDEATWAKGVGPGFLALLEATFTGALAGAASTVTSQAIESLPVGRAVAGSRPTLGDALSDSLAARAALRGTSSFVGGAVGGGVEAGIGSATGRFRGDAGDVLSAMGEAGLRAAVEESAAGPVDSPVRRAKQAQDSHRPAERSDGDTTGPSSGEPMRVDPADPRLRGDVIDPTPVTDFRLRREVRGAVVRLVGDTSGRQFPGGVVRLTDPVTVTLTGRAGRPVQVEISVVRGMGESDGVTPAARHTAGDPVDGVRRFTVEVSAGADPRHVELALARELTEIQSIDEKRTRASGREAEDTLDEQDTNAAVQTFLLLSDEYSAAKGGVAVFNRSLAEALADAGQNVIVRIGEDPALYAHEQRPNLTIIGPRGDPGRAEPRALIGAKDDPETMPKKVDYVVGHTRFSGPDARATRDARYPGAKVIHFVHMVPKALGRVQESTQAGKALEGIRFHDIERGLVAGSDLAVGVGPAITENARRMVQEARELGLDVATQAVHELIPGMEFRNRSRHSIEGRPLNVYISGRTDKGEKGTREAAEVVRMLLEVGVPARLTVRGVPTDKVEEQRLLLSQIVGEDVDVRPFTVARSAMHADLDEADVMVMTSRAEGFGLTAQEAAASGVPVVVPSTSGFGRWLGEPGRFPEQLTGPSIVQQGYEDPVPKDLWFDALRTVAEDYPAAQQRALDLQRQFAVGEVTWEAAVRSLIDEARRLR
jgi:glycosyltransferase involved in cell wall biosynthesis